MQELYNYLSLIAGWVEQQEALILTHGISLTSDQKIDAHLVGVKDIERVRLYEVDSIPMLEHEALKALAKQAGLQSSNTIGVTYRYGIYIKKGYIHSRPLIVHELAHTMQYERLGGIMQFLKQYLRECLVEGYPHGKLEQEARKLEREITGA